MMRVTRSDDPAFQYIGAQSAAAFEGGEDAGLGEALEEGAGLTQARAAEEGLADAEAAAVQVGQSDAAREEIAAAAAGGQVDAGLAEDSLHRLGLDQRDRPPLAGPAGEAADGVEVSVAFQPAANHDANLGNGDELRLRGGRGEDSFQVASHDFINKPGRVNAARTTNEECARRS